MITRSKMRRQLYKGGGIADLYPRQKFGVGSWFQDKKDKAINVFQKVVPNELADIAVKAAPFVAPFNPLAAGMMRGLGRLDQRGNLTDALKQGLATYGLGQLGQKMGTGSFQELQNPFTKEAFRNPVAGMFEGLRPPISDKAAIKTITDAGITPDAAPVKSKIQGPLSKFLYGTAGDAASQGAIGAGGEFAMKKAFGKGLPAVYAGGTLAALAVQAAMGDVGEREPGESLEAFNKRRKGTVGQYLDFYFRRANKFRIPPEDMDAAAADFVDKNTKEYSQGGRVGLYAGGEAGIKSLEAGAPDITYEGDMRMASEGSWEAEWDMLYNDYKAKQIELGKEFVSKEEFIDMHRDNNAQGGRIGYSTAGTVTDKMEKEMLNVEPPKHYKESPLAIPDNWFKKLIEKYKKKRTKQLYGTGPAGLPGIPRMAPDGMEFDMRQNGGFQPLGAKEKKDDVPAMLAKNEFVFTADAVRGAGGGDIELGAQRMYDTMKNLEKRVV